MRQATLKRVCIAAVSTILMISAIFPFGCAQTTLSSSEWVGPYVSKIIYRVIDNELERIQALLNGDVDIIGCQIDPHYIELLRGVNNIEISEILHFGYDALVFNCQRYPLNISGFRCAIAYAIDKRKIAHEAWLGFAEPLDCHIPKQHPASIEDELPYHYYDSDLDKGNAILDGLGFLDIDADGWRETPAGDDLNRLCLNMHMSNANNITMALIEEAFEGLGIPFWGILWDEFYNIRSRMPGHSYQDMTYVSTTWDNLDLDYYAREICSNFVDYPSYNTPNWSNATWDTLENTVLHSLDYEEILEATKKMELVWVQDCPAIILHQTKFYTAYRTDKFEGEAIHIFDGAAGFFSNLNMHLKTGTDIGGTLVYAIPEDIVSFNPYVPNSASGEAILNMICDPMVRIDPDGNDIDWMISSKWIETHDDNPEVIEGHTRITVNIKSGTTWSDGTPLTAMDYSLSLNFLIAYLPHAAPDISDLYSLYAMNNERLIYEYISESYWHWHSLSYKAPMYLDAWYDFQYNYTEYQPTPATVDQIVVCGPFRPTRWEPGVQVELSANPYYHRRLLLNTTSTATTVFGQMVFNFSLFFSGIALGTIVVTLTYISYNIGERRRLHQKGHNP